MYKLIFTLITFLCFTGSQAQVKQPTVKLLTSGTKTSIRGLSVVDDEIVWVSGSNGTIGKSIDGGKTWQWMIVKGFEKNDFRDIEAFDSRTAIIIAVGEPAYILKTINGGESWKLVYENKTKGMFLDAMEFWNSNTGIVLGDPIDGKFFIARTFDGGENWIEMPFKHRPAADSGEACFASSGTNIRRIGKEDACFVSGGLRSRLFRRSSAAPLPIVQGKESTGANSIAVWSRKKMIVVGGDFAADSVVTNNCFFTKDGGKNWISPATPPHGYRSCVEYITTSQLITCGTSGVDVSNDGGNNWTLLTKTAFHVCRKAKTGNAVFLAGGGGRIGKLEE
jgi:hypothetical protein